MPAPASSPFALQSILCIHSVAVDVRQWQTDRPAVPRARQSASLIIARRRRRRRLRPFINNLLCCFVNTVGEAAAGPVHAARPVVPAARPEWPSNGQINNANLPGERPRGARSLSLSPPTAFLLPAFPSFLPLLRRQIVFRLSLFHPRLPSSNSNLGVFRLH